MEGSARSTSSSAACTRAMSCRADSPFFPLRPSKVFLISGPRRHYRFRSVISNRAEQAIPKQRPPRRRRSHPRLKRNNVVLSAAAITAPAVARKIVTVFFTPIGKKSLFPLVCLPARGNRELNPFANLHRSARNAPSPAPRSDGTRDMSVPGLFRMQGRRGTRNPPPLRILDRLAGEDRAR